ncbi:MAG TPA: hypothetical protein VGJ07_19650 [Rugosimonospora sp.]
MRDLVRPALAVVVALAAAGVVAADQSSGAAASGDLYALSTTTGLSLMSGTHVVARAAVDKFYEAQSPGFTQDNRYAYLDEVYTADENAILAIDVRTGATTRIQCQCQTVTAAGGSAVAWFDENGALMEADLSAHPARAYRRAVTLPAVPGVDQYPYTVVAGDDGTLMVASQAVSPITPQLLIINPAGQVGRLRTPPPAFVPGPAAVWPGDNRTSAAVAVVIPDLPSACGHVGVDLINPLTGRLTSTDTSRISAGTAMSERVDDLWWGADATLYAAVTLSGCDPSQDQKHEIWRLHGYDWQTIGPDLVVDARQISPTTTIATLGTYSSKLIVTSTFSPVATNGEVVGMATPLPPAGDLSMTLRLGSSPCHRTALAAQPPRFLGPATVTSYACRDGYAYAAYAQGSGAAKVTRGQILAAIGPGWQVIAAGTAWDGRILDQDLRYAGLDVTAFQDRFPQTTEQISYTAPDMSRLVGGWTEEQGSQGTGRLVITNDAHAQFTYRVGSGPEYHVTLLFVRSTKDTAIAFASVSDDPNVKVSSRFYFEITSPTSLRVYKPYGYGDVYLKDGSS